MEKPIRTTSKEIKNGTGYIGRNIVSCVVAIYIAVSYKHEKSGLGKGCDGNCGSCGLRSCKTDKK